MKHHCQRFAPTPITRRAMLSQAIMGFGGVALAGLMTTPAFGRSPLAAEKAAPRLAGPGALRGTHFPARAKSVIFLYMDGGPSQVDTFDYKPALKEHDGKNPYEIMDSVEPTQFDDIGTVLQSPWKFNQYGESGAWVSDLFPHVAQCVDDIAFIKSMTSNFSIHTAGNYFLHTGHGIQGRPSMGSWFEYGLGSENENLPGFIVLNGGLIPPGGLDNFNSGFLPAAHQGSVFKSGEQLVANIHARECSDREQRHKLDLVQSLDQTLIREVGGADALESAVANYETAYRMQTAVPELNDISGESEETQTLYGLDHGNEGTRIFGRNCLLARRLVERGVRFVELTCPGGAGDRWDQHSNLQDGHGKNALNVDQPIAALLKDLKRRGMLEDTLVVWGGEFGRTPFAQGGNGRDHNPFGFTMWMAGGGVKGGTSIGMTDDFGYKVVDQKCEIHDLHATMLHLLGIDHERLTYRFSGRDMRLTDVYGNVLHDILA
ncbi:MAG: DUF1501 domain-containing protein [Phycisphaerales bacterium JB063]